jgi:hypothetical protein
MKEITFTTTLIPRFGVKNTNDRIYLNDDNLKEKIEEFNKKEIVYGQINWPDPSDPKIEMENVSHTIKNLRIYKNRLIGDITILDNPKGRELRKIYKDCVFRMSSLGKVDPLSRIVNISDIISFFAVEFDNDPFKTNADVRKRKLEKLKKKQLNINAL